MRPIDPMAERVRARVLEDTAAPRRRSQAAAFERYLAAERERFRRVAGNLWLSPEEEEYRRRHVYGNESTEQQPVRGTGVNRMNTALDATQKYR